MSTSIDFATRYRNITDDQFLKTIMVTRVDTHTFRPTKRLKAFAVLLFMTALLWPSGSGAQAISARRCPTDEEQAPVVNGLTIHPTMMYLDSLQRMKRWTTVIEFEKQHQALVRRNSAIQELIAGAKFQSGDINGAIDTLRQATQYDSCNAEAADDLDTLLHPSPSCPLQPYESVTKPPEWTAQDREIADIIESPNPTNARGQLESLGPAENGTATYDVLKGESDFRDGDFESAKTDFLKAIKLSPCYPRALYDLWNVAFMIDGDNAAIEIANLAHHIQPFDPSIKRSWNLVKGYRGRDIFPSNEDDPFSSSGCRPSVIPPGDVKIRLEASDNDRSMDREASLNAEINGKPIKMVLDTGGVPLVMNSAFARKYNIPVEVIGLKGGPPPAYIYWPYQAPKHQWHWI